MIWNPNKECMSRDEMSALQGKRLHKIVEYVYHNVPFYRHKLQELDLTPDDIRTIEDIVKLPYTTKKDLRDNYPFGLQAAPQSEIIRIHASSTRPRRTSGTTIRSACRPLPRARSSASTPPPARQATPLSWATPVRISVSGANAWRAA